MPPLRRDWVRGTSRLSLGVDNKSWHQGEGVAEPWWVSGAGAHGGGGPQGRRDGQTAQEYIVGTAYTETTGCKHLRPG